MYGSWHPGWHPQCQFFKETRALSLGKGRRTGCPGLDRPSLFMLEYLHSEAENTKKNKSNQESLAQLQAMLNSDQQTTRQYIYI